MKVGLVDVDGHSGYPNLALMKISAWHKSQGDAVEWYENPLLSSGIEKIYASKVFTFTQDFGYFPDGIDIERGGTGYDIEKKLPSEIDAMVPDYSIYPNVDYAVGFLSRGCIRKCPWCVVPKKEGHITQYSDFEKISINGEMKSIVLMDNNFLANDFSFVKEQLELSVKMGLKIDFNQALDCRLVTEEIAELLVRTNWIRLIRFSCDTSAMVEPLKRAISLMQAEYERHPSRKVLQFFVYVLAQDFDEAHERVKRIMEIPGYVTPFVMPYKNLSLSYEQFKLASEHPTLNERKIRILANWCNKAWCRKTCKLEDFETYKNLMKNIKNIN